MIELPPIEWRVHLSSAPDRVWKAWATDEGRASFWAEESRTTADGFALRFINGQKLDVETVEAAPLSRFVFRYFGGSTVTVTVSTDSRGGCDLHLREEGVAPEEHLENHAGWVSVLLGLKAAVDHEVDLRAHDDQRTWEMRFVDC